MNAETDLHQAMDAVAATTLSLDAARGRVVIQYPGYGIG